MIPSSTNLYHCIHKYPAFSTKKRKEESKAIQKKGNHNIISIFSFLCLNWHEEYNQISLLTVTHAASGEGEISFTIIDLLATFSSFFPFFGPSLCVYCGAIIQVVKKLSDQYLQVPRSVGHAVCKKKKSPREVILTAPFHHLNPPLPECFSFF